MIIVKYTTVEEKEQIINEQVSKGLELVSVANITEGNFLGFEDPTTFVIYQPKLELEEEVSDLKLKIAQEKADNITTFEALRSDLEITKLALDELLLGGGF